MQKRYLNEYFSEKDFEKWIKNNKVFLNFPTGSGKTTLILDSFLRYCRSRGKKVLILCNRSMLESQYDYDLAERYVRYEDLKETVEVMTYQRLGQILRNKKTLKIFFEDFDVICCDEAHFFYADSDFNSFDTYVLAQVLLKECFFKTMIFMSATGKEVRTHIYALFDKIRREYEMKEHFRNSYENYMLDAFDYDFEDKGCYEHITPYFIEDVESLCEKIASDDGKAIVFIDDKKLAEDFQKELLKTEKLEAKDIYVLNADILESATNDFVIRNLVMNNMLAMKVLITTSVLDNGISIHDSKVSNIIIATESRISFIQMLGRVRTEKSKGCNLYIYPRETGYYEKRVTQYQDKLKIFEMASRKICMDNRADLILNSWYHTDTETSAIKNAVVLTLDSWDVFSENLGNVRIHGRGILLAVNEFAKAKTGDMLLAEREFLKLRYRAPEEVAKKQIRWIGKAPEDLTVISSTYKEEMSKKLLTELLEIVEYTHQMFSDKKTDIAKKYQKILFSDLSFKGSSFENKKFDELCERYNLEVETVIGDDKRNRYSVKKKSTSK